MLDDVIYHSDLTNFWFLFKSPSSYRISFLLSPLPVNNLAGTDSGKFDCAFGVRAFLNLDCVVWLRDLVSWNGLVGHKLTGSKPTRQQVNKLTSIRPSFHHSSDWLISLFDIII